jgi:hypothetical protein
VEVLRNGLTVGDDREIAPLDVLGVVRALLAEHREDGVVEALGRVAVGDADVNMVEHPAYCAATSRWMKSTSSRAVPALLEVSRDT